MKELEEFKRLMIKAGFKKGTALDYIREIENFLTIYNNDLSEENISEYRDSTYSDSLRTKRFRAIKMFKDWILFFKKPRKGVRYSDECEIAPKIEEEKEEKIYYDYIYKRKASYKDSHSAMWI